MESEELTNFLEETEEAILDSGHKIEDVMFIGSSDGEYRLNYEEFKNIADFEYDDGYGGQEIAMDLIIYFKDKTYMKRGEYDGSEWWEYNTPKDFNENDKYQKYSILRADIGWETLEQLNGDEEDE